MIAFDWSTAPGNWPQLGPEIAETLRALATMPIAKLRELPEPNSKPFIYAPTIADIQVAVCEEFCLNRQVLMSKCRDSAVSKARRIAMYLAAEITKKNNSVIGRAFNRDSTTVRQACHRVYSNATGETADTIARLKAQLMP